MSEHMKMPIERRAKIFLPFAAVKGLDEALERKREERLMEDRIILSEDGEMEVDAVLNEIGKGDTVRATFYDGGRYRIIEGRIAKKDEKEGCIILENSPVISFKDIRSIKKIEDKIRQNGPEKHIF